MIHVKRQNIKYYFIAFYINFTMLVELSANITFLRTKEHINFLVQYNHPMMVLLMLAALYFIVKDHKTGLFAVLVAAWVTLFLVSLHVCPKISILSSQAAFYAVCLVITPACLFATAEEPDKLLRALIPYIYICVFYGIIALMTFRHTKLYSMSFSYYTVISVMLGIAYSFTHQRFELLLCSIFLLIANLVCGSRGSFVCVFLSIFFLYYYLSQTRKKFLWVNFLIIMLLLLFAFGENIVSYLNRLFPEVRTIRLLATGNYLHDSGRSEYNNNLIQAILSSGFRFHGLYSDRIAMAAYYKRYTVDLIWGSYAHNFFVEIMYQFGYLGFLILAVVVWLLSSNAKRVRETNKDNIVLFVIASSYAVGQLLFSSSYLNAISFGLFMGVLLLNHAPRQRKKVKIRLS